MTISWVDLIQECPLDVSRIKNYYELVQSNLPINIPVDNLNKCKRDISNARGYLDSMFNTLVQMLFDSSILKETQDKILFSWLTEDIARYLGKLDEDENHLMIKFDNANQENDMVGVSRISTYARKIQTSCDIIYESLFKSTREYNSMKEDKDKRTFLYILFQILTVTMAINGGQQRFQGGKVTKRNTLSSFPISTKTLMGENGKNFIKQGYQDETGIDVNKFEDNILSLTDTFDEGEENEENQ